MDDHFSRIYRERAEAYDRMVAAEDCDGRLRPAIDSICPLRGARIAEAGVGTGRLPRLFVQAGARTIVGVDASPAMLELARRHLAAEAPPGSGCQWRLEVGDASHLPTPDGSVELAIAGWVFGHMTHWHPGQWRESVSAAVAELQRVAARGGRQIVIETLGTGTEVAAPPNDALAEYYRYLETALGFERREIRTDYQFESPEAAAEACGFFFGEALVTRILKSRWARVPEWTGLWWRVR